MTVFGRIPGRRFSVFGSFHWDLREKGSTKGGWLQLRGWPKRCTDNHVTRLHLQPHYSSPLLPPMMLTCKVLHMIATIMGASVAKHKHSAC